MFWKQISAQVPVSHLDHNEMVQQFQKLLHHFIKSEIWQAVDKMENNSTSQKVGLVKISVCVQKSCSSISIMQILHGT